jgi:negative regulator of sigma E activity
VETRAGQGSQVTLLGPGGRRVLSRFQPATDSARMGDDRLATLLQLNYTLSATAGARVADRPATVIEASRQGRVTGRWWVDNATGIITWQETYDAQGAVQASSGFTILRLDDGGIIQHLPPRVVDTSATTTLALSNAAPLSVSGWTCEPELVGLPLIRIRTDSTADPTAVHLVYSDGLSTVSVFEHRGMLQGPPAGSRRDPGLDAYLDRGVLNQATWQSGDTVFTVTTDAPAAVAEAVRALPHRGPARPTTLERVQAGWAVLLAATKG